MSVATGPTWQQVSRRPRCWPVETGPGAPALGWGPGASGERVWPALGAGASAAPALLARPARGPGLCLGVWAAGGRWCSVSLSYCSSNSCPGPRRLSGCLPPSCFWAVEPPQNHTLRSELQALCWLGTFCNLALVASHSSARPVPSPQCSGCAALKITAPACAGGAVSPASAQARCGHPFSGPALSGHCAQLAAQACIEGQASREGALRALGARQAAPAPPGPRLRHHDGR